MGHLIQRGFDKRVRVFHVRLCHTFNEVPQSDKRGDNKFCQPKVQRNSYSFY